MIMNILIKRYFLEVLSCWNTEEEYSKGRINFSWQKHDTGLGSINSRLIALFMYWADTYVHNNLLRGFEFNQVFFICNIFLLQIFYNRIIFVEIIVKMLIWIIIRRRYKWHILSNCMSVNDTKIKFEIVLVLM